LSEWDDGWMVNGWMVEWLDDWMVAKEERLRVSRLKYAHFCK